MHTMATVLFDIGHPASYHLFKNAMAELRRRGHRIEIIARQKDCTEQLLTQDGWPYTPIPRPGDGLLALGRQSLHTLAAVVQRARRTDAAIMAGISLVIGAASRLTGATSLVFGDDDATVVRFYTKMAYPPAHFIVTPECLKFENYGTKHLTFRGYKELAYLHPNRFTPDPAIRDALGLTPDRRCFLVRLVALTAHHDIGERGLSADQARTVINRLARHGRVFISAEGRLDDDLRQYALPTPANRILDVIAQADMVVGDSQTMTAEAAVLGTPALRCNTFVGRLAYLTELEQKWGLSAGFTPDRFDDVLAQVDAWLGEPNIKAIWQEKRQQIGRASCRERV